MMSSPHRFLLAAVLIAAGFAAHAGKTTVCTITVNSADERDAFKRFLPADDYEFVELVERGRPDWLRSSCQKHVQCDVLVISGHFAGTEFYSSRFDVDESLPVDEMQRVACSESCPGLFSKLKEVYLFGCDTLKPEATRSATPEVIKHLVKDGDTRAAAEKAARMLSERYAETNFERMRRVFRDVPVIYGFGSLAPYGRVAGPMLERYFESAPVNEVGSGVASATLLSLFGPASMRVASGMRDGDPLAPYRDAACHYYDDRLTRSDKLEWVHSQLRRGPIELRMGFDGFEKFFAQASDADRADPMYAAALARLVADRDARHQYIGVTRDTADPALRVRMISLAREIGWLDDASRKAEIVRMIGGLLAADDVGFGEVDLICTLNKDGALEPALRRLHTRQAAKKRGTGSAAALACLGSHDGRAAVLKALASARESDVQIAQAYLRHRPIDNAAELRKVSLAVVDMGSPGAQARALEAIARHHVSDRAVLDALMQLYARTSSAAVQQAIAEVFLRSDLAGIDAAELATFLQQHRLAPGATDVVEVLLRRIGASQE
jgi:hypothetical protein